jgi:hypothetical protein
VVAAGADQIAGVQQTLLDNAVMFGRDGGVLTVEAGIAPHGDQGAGDSSRAPASADGTVLPGGQGRTRVVGGRGGWRPTSTSSTFTADSC